MKSLLKKTHLKPYQFIILIMFLVMLCILTTRLFYNQSIDNTNFSDLSAHIDESINGDEGIYSLVSIVFKFLHNYLGGNIAIAIFLSLINIATIIATKKLLNLLLCKEENNFLLWIYAIILNFIHPIILPFVSTGVGQWTVPYQVATIWYNSTYQCMKLFAIMIIMKANML